MSDRAEQITAEYLMRKVPEQDLPRFLNSPPIQDRNASHTSALETIAGFAVLALVAVIFGVML